VGRRAGAHGYVGATRWCNVKHPNTYAEMLAAATLSVAGFAQLGTDAVRTKACCEKPGCAKGCRSTDWAPPNANAPRLWLLRVCWYPRRPTGPHPHGR
jgi:coproporphyrinogen III oxidase-like Fe-S oxidoreductase